MSVRPETAKSVLGLRACLVVALITVEVTQKKDHRVEKFNKSPAKLS